jgi:hypothetical protein
VYPAAFVLLVAAVLVGVAVRPTQAQRATDLGDFLHDMTYDLQSCAGGVREALTWLHTIKAGTNHDVRTAVREVTYGAKAGVIMNLVLLPPQQGHDHEHGRSQRADGTY